MDEASLIVQEQIDLEGDLVFAIALKTYDWKAVLRLEELLGIESTVIAHDVAAF